MVPGKKVNSGSEFTFTWRRRLFSYLCKLSEPHVFRHVKYYNILACYPMPTEARREFSRVSNEGRPRAYEGDRKEKVK
jgi:hypothetical protein